MIFVKDLGMRREGDTTRRWCIAECPYCVIEKEIRTQQVKTTFSCGCATFLKARITHGDYNSRLYKIWQDMKDRCTNKNNKRFHRYGGRGILVDPVWNVYIIFKDWAISSGYTDTLTIDRVDNDGMYTASNCEWVTLEENIDRRNKYHKWGKYSEN